MVLNCGVGEDFGESLGQQGEPTIHPKGNQSWIFMGRTDVEAETPILWPPYVKNWLIRKRPWCWGRLKAGEGDKRGWDGWMASPMQWIWVWVGSRVGDEQGGLECCSPWSCQSVGHDWVTEYIIHINTKMYLELRQILQWRVKKTEIFWNGTFCYYW